MSKKAWIIGGVAVVAVIGATIIRRSLAGAPAKEEKRLRLLKS